MKIVDVFWNILKEQDEPNDVDFIFGEPEDPNDDQQNPPLPDMNEPEQQEPQPAQPQKPKQLSANQRLKLKWKEQDPAANDAIMDNAIQFFNNRKNGLRPIREPAPEGQPNQIEIVALRVRFPDMAPILTDPVRIRDIQNYSWEQISYYIDRASAVEIEEEINFDIDETSKETQYRTAMDKWLNFPKKIIDQDNFLVLQPECKEDAMALGRLQNLLSADHGGSSWCITYRPDRYGHVSNNWPPYRKEGRAFYFVLDRTKPETDRNYVGVIETTNRGRHNFTPRPNGTNSGVSWHEISNIYPQLRNKEHLLPYYGPTRKELEGADLDVINFREGDAYDFVAQKKSVQMRYVEDPHRAIPNKRAFSVLTPDLRRAYIGATNNDNLSTRYRCDDPADPFGILNMVAQDKQLLKTLEWRIINELGKPDGIMAIQKPILKLGMREGLNDREKKFALFAQKDNPVYGVMDMKSIRWEKPVMYIKSQPISLFKMENGKMRRFRLNRYTLENGEDYFYFLYEGEALTNPRAANYLIGTYYNKDDGDSFLNRLSDEGYRTFTKT